MTTEDKFKAIAQHDRALADSILQRSEGMDNAQIEAMINLEYSYFRDVQVSKTEWDMDSITKRFLGASESHFRTSNQDS